MTHMFYKSFFHMEYEILILNINEDDVKLFELVIYFLMHQKLEYVIEF